MADPFSRRLLRALLLGAPSRASTPLATRAAQTQPFLRRLAAALVNPRAALPIAEPTEPVSVFGVKRENPKLTWQLIAVLALGIGLAAGIDQLFFPALSVAFHLALIVMVLDGFYLAHAPLHPLTRAVCFQLAAASIVVMLWVVITVVLDSRPCPPPDELTVLTSTDGLAAASEVTEAYAAAVAEDDRRGCRPIAFTVFATGQGAQTDREMLIDGWDGEALLHGPRPDLWIPDSSAEARLVENSRDDGLLGDPVSAWHTPVVLAVPEDLEPDPRHESIGQMYQELADGQLFGARARPAESTAAQLVTSTLYSGPYDEPSTVETAVTNFGITGADETALLCALRQRVGETSGQEDQQPLPAVFTTERALMDYNRGNRLGTSCLDESPPELRLTAVYLEGVPGLDHPAVPLTWEDGGAAENAQAFVQWLADYRFDEDFPRPVGYRDPGGAADPVLQQTPGLDPDTVDAQLFPEDRTLEFASVLNEQRQAQNPVRALLLLDTSDSMQGPLANRRPAFQVATEQAAALLDELAENGTAGDEVGLWTFPRTGAYSDTEQRRLVDVGPAGPSADDIRDQLEGLEADLESTPLNDAVLQAVLEAADDGEASAAPVVFVFTEGIVGSGPGEEGSSVADVAEGAAEELSDGAAVELIMLDPGGCATGEPGGDLAEIDGINCTPVDLADPHAVPADQLQEARIE